MPFPAAVVMYRFLSRAARRTRSGRDAVAYQVHLRSYVAVDTLMPYTPILATLGYVLSPDRLRVLMIHRNARDNDHHLGKYNGLGGKLEANEDVATGMRREIHEEAGIECLELSLRGTISWPGFGRHGEDWFGFLFVVTRFGGEPLERNPEGTLEWVEVGKLHTLPLWEGDRHFLPLVFDSDPHPFHGVMPYKEGSMLSWSYSRI
jgi:8-oxo-dGTP diphosphatase